MFTYSNRSQAVKDGSPIGNVYFGRFTEVEKRAFLAGRLVISKPAPCSIDHYSLRRFGGSCEECRRAF